MDDFGVILSELTFAHKSEGDRMYRVGLGLVIMTFSDHEAGSAVPVRVFIPKTQLHEH